MQATCETESGLETSTAELQVRFNYVSKEDGSIKACPARLKSGRAANFRLRGDGVELIQGIKLPIETFDMPAARLRRSLRTYMADLARTLVGAEAAVLSMPLLRSEAEESKAKNKVDDLRSHQSAARPHDIVHNDYSLGFHDFLKSLDDEGLKRFLTLSRDESDPAFLQRIRDAKRIIVLQFWGSAQSEGTVIETHPLAICAPRSVRDEDHLIPIPLPEYGGVKTGNGFSIYLAEASTAPQHEWHWFPRMTRDEMLVWIGYDSLEKPMLPPFHSAFDLPHHANGVQPRESIECRVLCILDHNERFLPGASPGSRL